VAVNAGLGSIPKDLHSFAVSSLRRNRWIAIRQASRCSGTQAELKQDVTVLKHDFAGSNTTRGSSGRCRAQAGWAEIKHDVSGLKGKSRRSSRHGAPLPRDETSTTATWWGSSKARKPGVARFLQLHQVRPGTIKGDDDTDAGVKKRLTAVEERLTDLERRGLLPVRPTEALDWRVMWGSAWRCLLNYRTSVCRPGSRSSPCEDGRIGLDFEL